jgi:hypothetical protein
MFAGLPVQTFPTYFLSGSPDNLAAFAPRRSMSHFTPSSLFPMLTLCGIMGVSPCRMAG